MSLTCGATVLKALLQGLGSPLGNQLKVNKATLLRVVKQQAIMFLLDEAAKSHS